MSNSSFPDEDSLMPSHTNSCCRSGSSDLFGLFLVNGAVEGTKHHLLEFSLILLYTCNYLESCLKYFNKKKKTLGLEPRFLLLQHIDDYINGPHGSCIILDKAMSTLRQLPNSSEKDNNLILKRLEAYRNITLLLIH